MSPSVMEDSVFIPSGVSSLGSQLRTEASGIPLSVLEPSLTFYLVGLGDASRCRASSGAVSHAWRALT